MNSGAPDSFEVEDSVHIAIPFPARNITVTFLEDIPERQKEMVLGLNGFHGS
ncbi:MAG: hypothetical protein R3B65_00805 [Candidatus Paceibacterota bacterium]